MDKEAQEKMAHRSDCEVHNEPAFPNGYCSCGADAESHFRWWAEGAVKDITSDYEKNIISPQAFIEQLIEYPLDIMKQLGYRKLPKDKPPLLSDEQIMKLYEGDFWHKIHSDGVGKLLEAQREADIKHYEEVQEK